MAVCEIFFQKYWVIIVGAGAAHLPGTVAALTPLPVIGVPVRASALDGLDSLLSIVQDHSRWVLCRVYEHKNYSDEEDDGQELSCMDELFLSLDDDYDEICSSN